MTDFLEYQFTDSEELIETFDELPLWSASFGLLLLKHLELKPNLRILDLGSGAGFPLLELAERFGATCKCYGLDTWKNANRRVTKKIQHYGIQNAEVIEGSAIAIPFEDHSIDLIVSNLGINNFEEPEKVFAECARVLKKDGKLALTTNLNGHWIEFYRVFEATLLELKMEELVPKLTLHQEHRGNLKSISKLFTDSGFTVRREFKDEFTMRFLDGTAFLNHHFVKLGWLSGWQEFIPREHWLPVFKKLEENLNIHAEKSGSFLLTVPVAFVEGIIVKTDVSLSA